MDMTVLLDPLFRVPFIAGLLIALVLPAVGTLLRLRDEWLAALGFAHLSAASGLAGLAVGMPVMVGALLGASAGAMGKTWVVGSGNTAYAIMILAGWCATLLLAANLALGDALGHALVEGQLYFSGSKHLLASAALLMVTVALLPWLTRHLIKAQFFPYHERANELPAWRWHLGFDLLVALAMAIGISTVGLMGAFALIFVPPWLAFRVAPGWRAGGVISILAGGVGYGIAFSVAILLDQPFGPVLVAALLLMALPLLWTRRSKYATR